MILHGKGEDAERFVRQSFHGANIKSIERDFCLASGGDSISNLV